MLPRGAVQVRLVPPNEVPKRGKGGSLASRQALLHSLVHIGGSLALRQNSQGSVCWQARGPHG